MTKRLEIELKSKVERIKDLIHTIGRLGLTEEQTKRAIGDVGSLITKENLKKEELLELRGWIVRGAS